MGNDSKNIHSRVNVLVHDMLSECALQMFKVSFQYPELLSSYTATRNSIANDQKEIKIQCIQSRVMILVHDTLSECALQIYEVSLKYF